MAAMANSEHVNGENETTKLLDDARDDDSGATKRKKPPFWHDPVKYIYIYKLIYIYI